jgi:FKBP-type peptidyl-prolyl cis-trans isomerase
LSKKENDVLRAYIYRQQLHMQVNANGYYIQTLKKGAGETINDGDRVTLYARIWLLNGELCYEYTAQHPLEFTVGRSTDMKGLHYALQGLQQGAEVYFLFPSHFGYGLLGDDRVPPQSPLFCSVEIKQVDKIR